MPEIHVESLVKEFGEQRALDRVGFAVDEGELFTLLGPSGCGKSTTLMSIAGFQQPEEGRIAVGDETFFDADRRVNVPAERRNLGIVFQSYAVWPHMTVFDNVAFPLRVRKMKRGAIRDRVREVLDEEMARIREEVGDDVWEKGRPDETKAVFERVALSEDFVEFLTLPAYEQLD